MEKLSPLGIAHDGFRESKNVMTIPKMQSGIASAPISTYFPDARATPNDNAILHFWFTELTEKQHFVKDAALDALIALWGHAGGGLAL
jgi:hypothetical protein